MDFFEIGSHELFAQTGLKPWPIKTLAFFITVKEAGRHP
jgi:hypothetical protein